MFVFLLYLTSDEISETERLARLVERRHINKQKELNGFNCYGTGGGGDGERLTKLSLNFSTPEQLTVPQARRYLIQGIKMYQEEINSAEDFQAHIVESPFPIDRIEYSISVEGIDDYRARFPNGPTKDKKITFCNWAYGSIDYFICPGVSENYVKIHSETFEEAVTILDAEDQQ